LFREISKWYDANVGLRNIWVRIDNQVSYTFFNEVAYHGIGTQVVAGPHDWLFERHYINDAVRPYDMTDARLREFAKLIRSVQDKLARRGIPLLVVVGPNKAEVYPEHAPAAYFAGRDPDQVTTNFEHARPILQEAGVKFYDGPARFAEWKRAGVQNLFARSGSHWSYNSAFRVLGEVREQLNPHMRHRIPELKLAANPVGLPRQTDTDLITLLNLLEFGPYEHPVLSPVPILQTAVPNAQLPHILWVHDSFGLVLIEMLYAAHAARPSESLYYFANVYHVPGLTKTNLVIKDIDWKTFIGQYDAVVMVWTDIAFEHRGWGFFETLDRQLD
jgi:hypothetical protein